MMPSALMVALESLTSEWTNGPVSKIKPVPDKAKVNRIKAALSEALNQFSSELDTKGLAILRSKIADINRPVNAEQLAKPFAELSFTLTADDLEVIQSRNDFLHGRITLIDIGRGRLADQYTDTLSRQVYYNCLRIYTLIAVLILRQCGYAGKLVNYLKIYEHVAGRKLDEEYFRDSCYQSPIIQDI